MFIEEADFKTVIGDTALKVFCQMDEGIRRDAEHIAMEEVSGYLRPRYDCEAIFGKTGIERDPHMVMIVCDIALYHMNASTPGRGNAEVRKERYDRAIEWLESVQSGKVVPNLPLATDEKGESSTPVHWGSEKRHKNTW